MDYEKLYKEALERAKKWEAMTMIQSHKAMVTDIFPELKESDEERDKRIKHELLSHVNGLLERAANEWDIEKDRYKSWLAWLEKQKPVKWSEEDEDMLEGIKDDCAYGTEDVMNAKLDFLENLKQRATGSIISNKE